MVNDGKFFFLQLNKIIKNKKINYDSRMKTKEAKGRKD